MTNSFAATDPTGDSMRPSRSISKLFRSSFLLTAVALAAVGGPAHGSDLRMHLVDSSVCPHAGMVLQGQDVRIVAWNFEPGSLVKVRFSHRSEDENSNEEVIHEATADGQGKLDTIITIPTGFQTPALGYLDTIGRGPGGRPAWNNTLFGVVNETTIGGDSDSDGIPDACDNCPEVPNSDQADSDHDGGGDACDACPRDSMDDSDGDGLCGDVDEFPYDPDNDSDGDDHEGSRDDNCPDVYNPAQLDADRNGIGDACQKAPTCSDGIDNDEDGLTDFPADKGCSDADDTAETSPDLPCDDGIDNDSDALSDYDAVRDVGDPGCGPDTSLPENPECDDGIDNDGDGTLDWDGNFSGTPDPDCGGIGYGASES